MMPLIVTRPDCRITCAQCILLDPRTGARVPGVHGPPGFWAQTWPNHYEEEGGYTRSPQKANEGMWLQLENTFQWDIVSNNMKNVGTA